MKRNFIVRNSGYKNEWHVLEFRSGGMHLIAECYHKLHATILARALNARRKKKGGGE